MLFKNKFWIFWGLYVTNIACPLNDYVPGFLLLSNYREGDIDAAGAEYIIKLINAADIDLSSSKTIVAILAYLVRERKDFCAQLDDAGKKTLLTFLQNNGGADGQVTARLACHLTRTLDSQYERWHQRYANPKSAQQEDGQSTRNLGEAGELRLYQGKWFWYPPPAQIVSDDNNDANNIFPFNWWLSRAQNSSLKESLQTDFLYLINSVKNSANESQKISFLQRLAAYLDKDYFFPASLDLPPFAGQATSSQQNLEDALNFLLAQLAAITDKKDAVYQEVVAKIKEDAAYSLYLTPVLFPKLAPNEQGKAGPLPFKNFADVALFVGKEANKTLGAEVKTALLNQAKTLEQANLQAAITISLLELKRYLGLKLSGRNTRNVVSDDVALPDKLKTFVLQWIDVASKNSSLSGRSDYRNFLNLSRWTLQGTDQGTKDDKIFSAIVRELSESEVASGQVAQISQLLTKWNFADINDYQRMITNAFKHEKKATMFIAGLQSFQEKLSDDKTLQWRDCLSSQAGALAPGDAVELLAGASKELAWTIGSRDLKDPLCYAQLLTFYNFLTKSYGRLSFDVFKKSRDDGEFDSWDDFVKKCGQKSKGLEKDANAAVAEANSDKSALQQDLAHDLMQYHQECCTHLALRRITGLHEIAGQMSLAENKNLFAKKIFRLLC